MSKHIPTPITIITTRIEHYPADLKAAIKEEISEYSYFDFDLETRLEYGIYGIYLALTFGHNLQLWDKYGNTTKDWCYGQLSAVFDKVIQGWKLNRKY